MSPYVGFVLDEYEHRRRHLLKALEQVVYIHIINYIYIYIYIYIERELYR